MNNSKWSVSRRLNVAFGLVAVMTGVLVSLMYFQNEATERRMHDLVELQFAHMQQVTRFANMTSGTTLRLIAVNRSTDPAIAKQFGPEIGPGVKAIVEERERITAWATSAEEKALMETNAGFSKKLLAVINDMKAKREQGDLEAATALLDSSFLPTAKAYDGAMDALIALEQKNVDRSLEEARAAGRTGGWIAAAVLAVLTALTAWTCRIGHSLRRVLGAEPDEVRAAADAVRQGDLSTEIPVRPGDHNSIIAAMKAMRDNLVRVVSGVHRSADNVALASAGIASDSQRLSDRTNSQASALEETAASIDQLGATVRKNADNARQASQLATGASSVAVQGGEVVGQVVDTMKGINDSSRRIADIIGVIDGIAFQTNILALNAAVEAARAGEQGRGFAVVASEVRSLAQRSADAAKEIKSLIGASVGRVEQGTELVGRAGDTMREVVASIKRVADIIGEISAASGEQSQGVGQVSSAVTQMDQTTQQNAAMVVAAAAAADKLNGQAQELVQAMSVFNLGGDAVRH